jgi:hypothetical protein
MHSLIRTGQRSIDRSALNWNMDLTTVYFESYKHGHFPQALEKGLLGDASITHVW